MGHVWSRNKKTDGSHSCAAPRLANLTQRRYQNKTAYGLATAKKMDMGSFSHRDANNRCLKSHGFRTPIARQSILRRWRFRREQLMHHDRCVSARTHLSCLRRNAREGSWRMRRRRRHQQFVWAVCELSSLRCQPASERRRCRAQVREAKDRDWTRGVGQSVQPLSPRLSRANSLLPLCSMASSAARSNVHRNSMPSARIGCFGHEIEISLGWHEPRSKK